MLLFIETEITGKILETERLSYNQMSALFAGAKVVIEHSDEEKEALINDGWTQEEINNATDDLIEDYEADVMKITTTTGEFFILAQSIDGHGLLFTVRLVEDTL